MFIDHSFEQNFIAVRSAVIEIEYVRTLKIIPLYVKLRTKVREILQVAKYPAQNRFSYILFKSIFLQATHTHTHKLFIV